MYLLNIFISVAFKRYFKYFILLLNTIILNIFPVSLLDFKNENCNEIN